MIHLSMRLDHIAYRVADRQKTAKFLMDAFGYKVQTEFDLEFEDGSTTQCLALEPPEKDPRNQQGTHESWPPPRVINLPHPSRVWEIENPLFADYHQAPELFVSDGSPDSIVGKWVAARDGIGGVHHLAYEVDDVEETMRLWQAHGWADFASSSPLTCPGLTQVFTTPHPLTGVIYEFIKREGDYGFCADNVKNLMISTQEL